MIHPQSFWDKNTPNFFFNRNKKEHMPWFLWSQEHRDKYSSQTCTHFKTCSIVSTWKLHIYRLLIVKETHMWMSSEPWSLIASDSHLWCVSLSPVGYHGTSWPRFTDPATLPFISLLWCYSLSTENPVKHQSVDCLKSFRQKIKLWSSFYLPVCLEMKSKVQDLKVSKCMHWLEHVMYISECIEGHTTLRGKCRSCSPCCK